MLYEYTADGKVVERVRPATDSPYAMQLADRAADPESGWAQVDEQPDPAPEPAPAKAPRGRAATPSPETETS